MPTMQLHDFRVLTFDCHSILIDWESGIIAALQPLLWRSAPAPSRNAALEAFARCASTLEFGLATAWIDRRHDQAGWGQRWRCRPAPSYEFRFPSSQAMADAHRAEA
jgi:hypothetical protein